MKTNIVKNIALLIAIVGCASACNDPKPQPQYYIVDFAGENISIEPQSIERGKFATKPENPKREGCDFSGWFTDNGTFGNEWDFETDVVTQNTTLYAQWIEKPVQNYPIEIPFAEYSLIGTSCQWKRLSDPYPYTNTVAIINNCEDLEKYIECVGEKDYLDIDFSTHTLLLAYGVEGYEVIPNYKNLQQLSAQNYTLNINLFPYDASVITYWQVPIIVNKITDDCIVELVITKNP